MSFLTSNFIQSFRRMRRAPLFTAVTLLTLAIGIGANTAIFSILNTVLIRPLPYPQPDALVGVFQTAPGVQIEELNASPATYFTYREEGRSFEDIGMWSGSSSSITGTGEPEQVDGLLVTDATLPLLRARPALGRLFSRVDDQPGSPHTMMLSYGYFQRRFGGDPKIIGQKLVVDGNLKEIIGVLPEQFRFLNRRFEIIELFQWDRSKVFVGNFSYRAIARLKPGVTIQQANADVMRMIAMLPQKFKLAPGISKGMLEESKMGPRVQPLKAEVIGDAAKTLWLLMVTVGIVLLIACANVANLLLVKADGRQQELAVRAALGASRMTLTREMLTETLTLAALGGLLGVGVASAAIQLLIWLAPANLPRLGELSIDATVLGFAAAITLLAGVSLGLAPVLKYAGPQLQTALRAGNRNVSDGRQRHRTRNTLVVVQVTMAMVLLLVSGLLIRSSIAMHQVHPGFTLPEQILTLRLFIPEAQVKDPHAAAAMERAIVAKLSEIPGVTTVGMTTGVTMDGNTSSDPLYAEDKPIEPNKFPPLRRHKNIGPGYFAAMGNSLVAGRDVTWTDIFETRPVAIVSQNLALEMWGSPQAALGKRVKETSTGIWREVVGVAGIERQDGPDQAAPKIVYWPLLKRDFWGHAIEIDRSMIYVIRSQRTGTSAFTREVQQAIWSVNPQLPIANLRTVKEIYNRALSRTTFTLLLLSISAGMALLLGIIGIYGVISYSIAQRTREIGIRMALGAPAELVRRMFLNHGVLLAAIGVACGFAITIPLTQYMTSFLFEVSPIDPLTYALVPAFLLTAAALAAYLPARRASRIAPVEALRGD
ncbi:ABC transporter permease [Bryobacter aggregatus]|uniref:ABC transporter permease n=1 Tax=Bryobacter aggregatus TaxID=360054 RepID=UPI00068D2559|nr:ABC transporter permease [Bryobacter aggregatus]